MAQRKTASKASGKRRTSKRSTKKAGTSRPTRSRSASASGSPSPASDEEVSLDRRRTTERRFVEKGGGEEPAQSAPPLERRQKVNRRRQIDPTTCERDYTEDEVEFMNALDDYKRRSGRMFPTCSEVLEVVRSLGYLKVPPAELEAIRGTGSLVGSAKPMPEWPVPAGDEGTSADEKSASVDDAALAY